MFWVCVILGKECVMMSQIKCGVNGAQAYTYFVFESKEGGSGDDRIEARVLYLLPFVFSFGLNCFNQNKISANWPPNPSNLVKSHNSKVPKYLEVSPTPFVFCQEVRRGKKRQNKRKAAYCGTVCTM